MPENQVATLRLYAPGVDVGPVVGVTVGLEVRVAKPNYRHQKRQRETQRLTRQAEKLQKRLAAKGESGEPGEPGAPGEIGDAGVMAEATPLDPVTQKPTE